MNVFDSLRADLQGNNPVVDPVGGYDCLIVGAGPAGLHAARYLGRYGRSCLVADGGNQRASMIPTSHNIPGFTGVHGSDLLEAMRGEARAVGAIIEPGWVTDLGARDTGGEHYFVATLNGRDVRAKTVLLATGVKNHRPVGVDNNVHDAAVAAKLIRYCPICDGLEATGKKIVSIGSSAHGVAEVLFIYRYSQNITIMPDVSPGLTDIELELMDALGVRVLNSPLVSTTIVNNQLQTTAADGSVELWDVMYPSLGSHCYTELATGLGCTLCPDGEIAVDAHFATNVAGVWAAGDVVEGLDQVVVAEGQAAVTATAIHNSMRSTELQLIGELPVPNKNSSTKAWTPGTVNGTVFTSDAGKEIRDNVLSALSTASVNPLVQTTPQPALPKPPAPPKPPLSKPPLLNRLPVPSKPPVPKPLPPVPHMPAMPHPAVPDTGPVAPKPAVAQPVVVPKPLKPPRPAVI